MASYIHAGMAAGLTAQEAMDMPMAVVNQLVHALAAYNGQPCVLKHKAPESDTMAKFAKVVETLDSPPDLEDL